MTENAKIIINCIKNMEQILKEKYEEITPELREKLEQTIYKGYEELSKLLINTNISSKQKDNKLFNETNNKTN